MKTAEWICTKCGTTNRRLVENHEAQADDRCVSCGARHRVTRDPRPVRWQATLKR
jgi:DNA-directed RNA polymerase subunit RPC12/RpoP